MTAITTAAQIDAQTQEELMRQAGIWIEHSTLIEDDMPARPLASVQAEKHQLDRYTQLVAARAGAAPAAVSPQGEYPQLPEAAVWSVAGEDGMPTLGKGWMFSPVQQSNATLPLFTARQMWAYHDLGRQSAPAAPALEAPAAPDLRQTRDKAGILHYLTPEQMAEEIVRLDARLAAAPQAPAQEAPAAPAGDLALIVAALEHGQPQMAHYAEPCERHAQALAAARRLAAAPQAPASVAGGWKLVPEKPTDAMLGAAQKAWLADPLRRSSTLYAAALAAAPQAPVQEAPARAHVAVLQCDCCGHIGINDAADGRAACNTCDWQGDSPSEDKCPGCQAVGTMTSACAECGARTSTIAETHLQAAPQAPAAPVLQLPAARAGRIYVAGPMTGLPDHNFPAFNAAAVALRAKGWHVENPAEHGILEGAEWADYLHYDMGRLATCSAVHLLPGWSKSRGATLEVHVATTLGMPIFFADGAEPVGAAPAAPAVDAALPSWWPDFIQCVAELPDRNSPEDEPDAMIATAEELGACALAAQAKGERGNG
ncbi:MAG: DUF4406 domain-containing protein [Burkholderiaceae bacterium]|jgi:hypothetical protein|nr:DUF4406 domain-containing protein [Burkholderiaceae bacterium]